MKQRVIAFLLLMIFTLPLVAQVDRSKMPEPGPAPEIQIGDYESFQLDNGLKVFVVENDKLPKVSFSLQLDRDPILEGENIGYVQASGDLMRTATATMNKDQIDEAIDMIGANLGIGAQSAYGSCLSKHKEDFVKIFADVVVNAKFKQEELDKAKKQIISGLKAQKDDPKAIANNVRKAVTYGKDHPYGEIMTEESIDKVTLDMCEKYYNTYWRPNIAYMAIVGDIDVDEAEELITEYFAGWEKKEVPSHEYKTPRTPLIRKVNLVDRAESVQSVIHVTYPIVLKKGDKDVIPVRILNTILGGNFSSRLNQNLREDHGWTYGARSSMVSDMLVGSFDANCEARTSVTDSAVTEFLNEIKMLKNEKISKEELENTKKYLIGSFSRSLENPNTIANFALSIERYGLPQDYYKTYLQKINKVSVEDIQTVAKKYLKPNKSNILVVGNASEIADKIKKFSPSGKLFYYDIYGNKYDPSAKKLPKDLTAQKIFDNYVKAVGGADKLTAMENVKMRMEGTVQGMNIVIDVWKKAPNKFKMALDAGVMKQSTVFDGEKGKSAAMGKEQMIEGEKAEELAISSRLNAVLHYDELGVKSELVGMDKVDGMDAYKVKLEFPTGKTSMEYYDVETFLKLQDVATVETPQGKMTQKTGYSDYKEVDGIKFPFQIMQQFGPQNIEMKVTECKVNTEMDDTLFEIK